MILYAANSFEQATKWTSRIHWRAIPNGRSGHYSSDWNDIDLPNDIMTDIGISTEPVTVSMRVSEPSILSSSITLNETDPHYHWDFSEHPNKPDLDDTFVVKVHNLRWDDPDFGENGFDAWIWKFFDEDGNLIGGLYDKGASAPGTNRYYSKSTFFVRVYGDDGMVEYGLGSSGWTGNVRQQDHAFEIKVTADEISIVAKRGNNRLTNRTNEFADMEVRATLVVPNLVQQFGPAVRVEHNKLIGSVGSLGSYRYGMRDRDYNVGVIFAVNELADDLFIYSAFDPALNLSKTTATDPYGASPGADLCEGQYSGNRNFKHGIGISRGVAPDLHNKRMVFDLPRLSNKNLALATRGFDIAWVEVQMSSRISGEYGVPVKFNYGLLISDVQYTFTESPETRIWSDTFEFTVNPATSLPFASLDEIKPFAGTYEVI